CCEGARYRMGHVRGGDSAGVRQLRDETGAPTLGLLVQILCGLLLELARRHERPSQAGKGHGRAILGYRIDRRHRAVIYRKSTTCLAQLRRIVPNLPILGEVPLFTCREAVTVPPVPMPGGISGATNGWSG